MLPDLYVVIHAVHERDDEGNIVHTEVGIAGAYTRRSYADMQAVNDENTTTDRIVVVEGIYHISDAVPTYVESILEDESELRNLLWKVWPYVQRVTHNGMRFIQVRHDLINVEQMGIEALRRYLEIPEGR